MNPSSCAWEAVGSLIPQYHAYFGTACKTCDLRAKMQSADSCCAGELCFRPGERIVMMGESVARYQFMDVRLPTRAHRFRCSFTALSITLYSTRLYTCSLTFTHIHSHSLNYIHPALPAPPSVRSGGVAGVHPLQLHSLSVTTPTRALSARALTARTTNTVSPHYLVPRAARVRPQRQGCSIAASSVQPVARG